MTVIIAVNAQRSNYLGPANSNSDRALVGSGRWKQNEDKSLSSTIELPLTVDFETLSSMLYSTTTQRPTENINNEIQRIQPESIENIDEQIQKYKPNENQHENIIPEKQQPINFYNDNRLEIFTNEQRKNAAAQTFYPSGYYYPL